MEAQAIINAFKNGEIDATDVTTGSAEILSNFLDMEDAEIRRGYSLRYRLHRDQHHPREHPGRRRPQGLRPVPAHAHHR